MKPLKIILTLCIFSFLTGHAQDSLKKEKIFKAVINPSTTHMTGFLANIADSSVYLSSTPALLQFRMVNTNLEKFDYRKIDEIKIHRKGSVGKGVLIGSIAGMITGAIISAATYKEPVPGEWNTLFQFSKGETIFAGALFGAMVGAGTGAIIGAVSSRTYLINGNWENLEEMKMNLKYK
jgi:hypothetical protein